MAINFSADDSVPVITCPNCNESIGNTKTIKDLLNGIRDRIEFDCEKCGIPFMELKADLRWNKG